MNNDKRTINVFNISTRTLDQKFGEERHVFRNSFFASLRLCVIFLLFLFPCILISCQNALNPSLPKNMGSITLNLTENNARTILPSAPATNEFAVYELVFTAAGGTAVNKSEDRTNATLATNPVVLVAGTYNLTVNAYKTAKNAANLAAQGSVTGILITDGQNTTQAVTLSSMFTSGSGNFSWNITLPSNVTSDAASTAKMTLKKGGTPVGSEVNLKATPNGNWTATTLTSGLYTVTVNLTATESGVKKAFVWNELMHVYATLNTSFTKTFAAADLYQTHYNVSFNAENGVASESYLPAPNYGNAGTPQSISHGGLAAAPTGMSKPGYLFGNWFTDAACTTQWNFANKVYKDTTLYAKWTANTGSITLTVEDIYDPANGLSGIPANIRISRGSPTATDPATLTITIGGAPAGATLTWSIDALFGTVLGTGNTFMINGTPSASYSTLGGHILYLLITLNSPPPNIFNLNIPFTIVP
jgi:uncharacterized repeat protein (TIGR02543 family)